MTTEDLLKWFEEGDNSDGFWKYLLKLGYRKTTDVLRENAVTRLVIMCGFYLSKTEGGAGEE